MTETKLHALCPYEIGEEIIISRKIFPPELAFSFPPEAHTITDIVCQHSEKTGETVFLYELDGRDPLVQIQEPKKKRRK